MHIAHSVRGSNRDGLTKGSLFLELRWEGARFIQFRKYLSCLEDPFFQLSNFGEHSSKEMSVCHGRCWRSSGVGVDTRGWVAE